MPRSIGISEAAYRSPFRAWHTRAAVRTKPRRQIEDAEPRTHVYFPPELVPVAQHPLVQALGDDTVDRVLIQNLHTYLEFTSELEHGAVNPVVSMISRRRSGFDLPETMIEDAYKIYTDEAWHAQHSDDLGRQVAVATGVGPGVFEEPNFFRKLNGFQQGLSANEQRLVMIFFTIVSETLISAILSGIPSDERVVMAVREVVADHDQDERRHSAYFSRLLEFAWPRLNKAQRAVIGPLLPEMVLAFLEPDFVAIAGNLRACGLTAEQIDQVMTESYPPGMVKAGIRSASRATIRHFERVGVVDDPRTAEALEGSGLWP
ncbi:diiron oxygenase [Solirubrobacter soli]|uniref:diiron oxygenase n=1 Tax=Solirubrobacter soli TaxID=363832 RepID=UPI00146EB053|nr:diiron oxygenase [Solirubrobacter soli]